MEYNKNILYGLSNRCYEHPFDRKALEMLENKSFLTKACKWVTENTVEKIYTIQYTGSHLKITKDSYPQIFEYLEYVCNILGLKKIPDMYLRWDYDVNACTIGAEKPIIIINSGLIDLCTDDEILFVIGHEVGHILSNHMLYHMLAQVINYVVDSVPGGHVLAGGIQYALYYWERMSEFTADRAGLLGCQNIDAALGAFIKISGLPKSHFDRINKDAFIQQARDFKLLDIENMNKVFKIISISDSSHPWTIMRAAELLNWVDKGGYRDIVMHCTRNIEY